MHALALELVEGPTLAEYIARRAGPSGPAGLPLDEALPIARQIADALEAAHEQGIIHRDLKPTNVKVREDGTVKVLDFGLAKALEGSSLTGAAGVSMSPTMSVHATHAGVILGTAAYMSPEQARGKTVDKRSDVWAFGCVLYEMLTGTRAFEGDEVSDVLAAILRAEPDLRALPAETPTGIRRLLKRCLEKDRRERLPDIGTARLEIKDVLAAPADTAVAPAAAARGRWTGNSRLAWSAAAVAGAIAIAAAALAAMNWRNEPPSAPVARFQIFPPANATFMIAGNGPALAMSPDGSQLAFAASANDGKPNRIWIRRMDAIEATPMPGTEAGTNPFWSPDGRSIAFFAGPQVKRIDIAGGPPQVICASPANVPAGGASAGAWGPDGTILFWATGMQVLHRVPAGGGTPVPVTALDTARGEIAHFWPRFLPDGRHFLFWVNSGTDENRGIRVGSLDSQDVRQIVRAEFAAEFAP